MLAYIQISNTITDDKQYSFHQFYRNCFSHVHHSATSLQQKCKPGNIVGVVLFAGYLPHEKYSKLIDAANQQHLKFYKTTKNKSIYCYPVIATFPFDVPIKSTQPGQMSALKIKPELFKTLQSKLPTLIFIAMRTLFRNFQVSRNKHLSHRILTLRKEHAINLMMGIKSAEFRTKRLGDEMLGRIKAASDHKKLLLLKKKPNANAVKHLSKFCQ